MNKLKTVNKYALAFILLAVFLIAAALPIFAANPIEANADEMAFCDDLSYLDGSSNGFTTERIEFANKKETSYFAHTNFPDYYNTNSSISNTCANSAGANVLGYYNRYYSDLIPGNSVGLLRGDTYYYFPMAASTSIKQGVINTLYSLMGTNTPAPGTTQAQFKSGMASYVKGKSKTITYTNVMSNSKFSVDKAKASFDKGEPIILYLSGYNLTAREDLDTSYKLHKYEYSANHMMVAYGYSKIEFYNSSGSLIKAIEYLHIAACKGESGFVYLLNGYGTMVDAEAAKIS